MPATAVLCIIVVMKVSALLAALLVLVFAVGCTGAPPELLQDHADVYVYRDRRLDTAYERLAFFVSARDEDGFEDIETLFLVHDDKRLHWPIDADTWQRQEREEETWIGRNDVQMADYSAVPRGAYRVILVDAAGERDERDIRVSSPEVALSSVTFPKLEVANDRFILDTIHRSHTIHAFDNAGNLIVSREFGGRVLPVSEVVGANRNALSTFSIYVYTFDEENRIPLLVGPFQF